MVIIKYNEIIIKLELNFMCFLLHEKVKEYKEIITINILSRDKMY